MTEREWLRDRRAYLKAEDLWLGERKRFAVHFDKTFASLDEQDQLRWWSLGCESLPCNERRRLLRDLD